VKGTGAGGRITKQDVEGYMSAQGARTMPKPASSTVRTPWTSSRRVARYGAKRSGK
jgi:pyruvate/2-oxoglutarate dehydrogenase complex dihydrolipoamide acyltransferase (E2) component